MKPDFAALQAVAEACLEAGSESPSRLALHRMLLTPAEEIARRARVAAEALAGLPAATRTIPVRGKVGGGSLPEAEIPLIALAVRPLRMSAEEPARRLRTGRPPAVGAIREGEARLAVRAALPEQDERLIQALRRALS